MKRLTERDQIRTVAARWHKSYPVARKLSIGDSGEIYARLLALDCETATADDVYAAIGNRSWVGECVCNECGEHSWGCVEVGEPPDYESRTCTICAGCLKSALDLAKATP